jgi:DNA-3-methyladenine glycosylase II
LPREGAWEHLRAADPVLAGLLDAIGEPTIVRGPRPTHYGALVRSIVGQQVSTHAARAIHERLLARYDGREPTPEEILAEDPEELRAAAGLSRAKTAYLRSLAEHALDGSLDLDGLASRPESEVMAALTAVRGIGEWSAQIFLMFQLGRPDVLPVGDLGVRRAAERAYELPGLPSAAELLALGEPWRPHRTAASELLWHSLHVRPAA